MKKNLNKLATLALTGMMVAGMSFGAMAEDGQTPAASSTYTNVEYTAGKIVKEVKTDGKTFAPNTSFGFEVSQLDSLSGLTFKRTVRKDDGETYYENIGDEYLIAGTKTQAEKIKIADAKFTAADKGSASTDEENKPAASGSYKKEADVTIKENTFNKPGIYVFKLTETVPTDKDKRYEGVVYDVDENDEANTHYLLVEVRNKTGVEGLEVTNIYMQKANHEDSGSPKEESIVNYYGAEGHDEVYDLTIEKLIEGLAADRSEKFNFKITVAQDGKSHTSGTSEKYAYYTQKSSDSTETYGGFITAGDQGIKESLGMKDKLHIYGLSAGDKVTVEETSGTGYTRTYEVTENGGDANNVNKGTALNDGGACVYAKANGAKMTVTNTKDEITVTGVAMNVAPYAAMVLGAGAFAGIFLGGKRRKAEDED